MPQFRKRPILIEAYQVPFDHCTQSGIDGWNAITEWLKQVAQRRWQYNNRDGIEIETLEGVMTASPGDWIIKGVKGEIYPCKPDVFAATYEPAEATSLDDFDHPIHSWFELSYAQFLTVPRLVLESMPLEWQHQMAALLQEMDDTFDWRPKEGRYWVRLKDAHGRFCDAPLNDYRHGSVEHLRYPTR